MSDNPNPNNIIDPNAGPPPFPIVEGADKLSDADRSNIAKRAWEKAFGSIRAFEMMVAEHIRGDIDLFEEAVHGRAAPAPAAAVTGGTGPQAEGPGAGSPAPASGTGQPTTLATGDRRPGDATDAERAAAAKREQG